MVPLVDGLAVGHGGQPVEEGDAEPPPVGVGCVGVEGLRQPIGRNAKQQPGGQFIEPFRQPSFVNFERVVGQVHPVRDDGVHHRVQMTVEHPSVEVQQAKTRLEEFVG